MALALESCRHTEECLSSIKAATEDWTFLEQDGTSRRVGMVQYICFWVGEEVIGSRQLGRRDRTRKVVRALT